ncbi:MAG: amidohydrolase family protein [Chloroflexi bacterium]|nr:amidohydrolase family protein [Chloroflexota bacterium]
MIDANAYLGNWPFRKLRYTTHIALLDKMDALGIEKAVVSSLENVFYKDQLAGNRHLHAEVHHHALPLIPPLTITPTVPCWEEDLAICVRECGMRVMRLHPNYHQFALDSTAGTAVLEAARAHDFVVILTTGLEDTRHHHPLIKVPDVPGDQIAAAVSAYPDVRFLVAAANYSGITAIRSQCTSTQNLHFEISRVQGPVGDIEKLCGTIGADRVLLGTNLPLHVPEAATLAIEHAKITAAERRMIVQGNADRLFGLE